MSKEMPKIQQETEIQDINFRCKNLLIICNSLLNNYGERKKVELSDSFYTHFGRILGIVPKEIPVIDRMIYLDRKWQRITIIDKKHRVDIVLEDQKGRLVLGKDDSWIQLPKKPYRDISEHCIPPVLTRPVTPDDLQKYEQAIGITKRDLITSHRQG